MMALIVYDLIITNGRIIDPESSRITIGSICIKDGKIKEITRENKNAACIVDAAGKYVSPGFIDIHTHIEGKPFAGEYICQQGVTTVVNGNCGLGMKNPVEFIAEQNKKGFIVNQLELIGATILRERVDLSDPLSPMNSLQLDRANGLLKEQLQGGGAGLSFGLEYVPGSSREEVLTLSRTAAKYGKLVAIHTRADNYQGLAALEEAIDIAKITGAPVQISHVVYQYGFGMMKPALEIIDNAVNQGYDISADSGMYTNFATRIGTEVFAPACFEKWKSSYDTIYMTSGKYAGQYLNEKTYHDVRKNYPGDIAIALVGNPYEVNMAFELPYMMVTSDAGINSDDDPSMGHPQDAGTFPRFIDQLVKKSNQLTLMDAVKRITILPAKRMGLTGKGRIAAGCDADLVIFSLDKITDNAKFSFEGKCDALPDGIDLVIVAGQIAINNKKVINNRSGHAIPVLNHPWEF